ncbi:general secretion pathway protein K [Oceanospirillum multiglobuliferum]|uniref:Type II secretion system protein K n=2 Tax=Oceanospirillum TaxID=965 RepID=A0A1T4SCQ9_9GAMM|nr:type II secretion system minor pseudopilin GspK [Oceanospirillum multiglobuliferum]OPX55031.1 hypothetical protein BTE48_11170 [Oceanospirillum multiglobuliferum]SKA25688.1 general secretion pathway protein K [Oceanospirillum multiglobuliferum]
MKKRHCPKPMQTQRGVALISVLLIFAIAAALAVRMMSQGSLKTQEVSVYLQQQQLHTYSRSVESYALTLLQSDWQQDAQNGVTDAQNSTAYDHLSEDWAKAYRFPLDQMQTGALSNQKTASDQAEDEIHLRIEALDSYFNLNNLIPEQGTGIDLQMYNALQHLLVQKQIPESVADLLTDWIDSDNDPISLLGAEDNQYLLLQPPYRSASQPMHNLSEAFLLNQIDPQSLAELPSVITALPMASLHNLNLVLPEVMAALFQTSSEQAKRWLLEREQTPISNVSEFLSRHQLKPELAKLFSTRSQYFQLNIKVQIETQTVYLRSLVQRDLKTGELQVLARNTQPFADKILSQVKSAQAQ